MYFIIYLLGLFSSIGCFLLSFPFYDKPFVLLFICISLCFIQSIIYFKIKDKKTFYILNAVILFICLFFAYYGFSYYKDVILKKYMDVSSYTFTLSHLYNFNNSLYINVLTSLVLLFPINIINLYLFNKKKHILTIFTLFPLIFIEILFTITPPFYCIGGYILYCLILIFHKNEKHINIIPIVVILSLMISIITVIPPSSYKHPRSRGNKNELSYSIPTEGDKAYDLMSQGNRYYMNKVDLIVQGITGESFKLRGNVYNHFSGKRWYQETTNISRDYQYSSRVSYLASLLNCQVRGVEVIDNYNSKTKYVPYYILSLPDNIKYYESHFEGEDNGEYIMVVPNNQWNEYMTSSTHTKTNFPYDYDMSLPKLNLYTFNTRDYYIPEDTKKILADFLIEHEIYEYYFNFEDILSSDQLDVINSSNLSLSHEPLEYIEKIKKVLFEETEYSLQPGLTPNDSNFFDYFLNENKKGYCVHYASTLALLLNLSGIEANYVTGYQVDSSRSKNGYTEVLDSDAHAWVEIYDPVLGIIPIEATPAQSISSDPDDTINNPTVAPNNPTTNNPTIPNRPDNIINNDDINIPTSVYIIMFSIIFILLIYIQSRVRYKYSFYKLNNKQKIFKMYNRLNIIRYELSDEMIAIVKKGKFSQHDISDDELNQVITIYNNSLTDCYNESRIIKKLILKIILAYV